MPFSLEYLTWAVIIGTLSAVSLPIGSIFGLITRPRASLMAILSAFGGGALLAALAVELVAPTVMALGHPKHQAAGHGGGAVEGFVALAVVAGAAPRIVKRPASIGKAHFLSPRF